MVKTADLGRAGAALEAEMAKGERLKYFRAGMKEGYKLAIRDMRYQLEEMSDDGATKYGNAFIDISIHEPGED